MLLLPGAVFSGVQKKPVFNRWSANMQNECLSESERCRLVSLETSNPAGPESKLIFLQSVWVNKLFYHLPSSCGQREESTTVCERWLVPSTLGARRIPMPWRTWSSTTHWLASTDGEDLSPLCPSGSTCLSWKPVVVSGCSEECEAGVGGGSVSQFQTLVICVSFLSFVAHPSPSPPCIHILLVIRSCWSGSNGSWR